MCTFLLGVGTLAEAQNPGTGLYPFGSFDSRGFDSVNIGNLNTHFEIPIVNKQGRGLSFNYSLAYDGLVWSSTSSSGTGYWQPDSGWGFHGQLLGAAIIGYMTYDDQFTACPRPPGGHGTVNGELLTNYVYHDPYGRNHSFHYSRKFCPLTDPDDTGIPNGIGNSNDGSGLHLNTYDLTVHTRSGQIINTSLSSGASAGSITDSNGNTVTNNWNGIFTDTLGVTALTIGGTGSASSPLTLSYPVTLQSDSATTATATAYYRTYTVQTNFQCSGITEYGATSTDLMDHITLADGASTYSFTYEPTPGFPGSVTGRLASVTLPTGGTINFSYSGGCNNSGINADGTVANLTRTTSEGSRSYTTSAINGNATSTSLVDEANNLTIYNFTTASGMMFETQHQVYQGSSSSGPNLLSSFTCYNGVVPGVPGCDGNTITLPITQTNNLINYNGDGQLRTVTAFDSVTGLRTQITLSDWAGTFSQTTIGYNGLGEVLTSTTTDGTNTIASASYGYDETSPTVTSGIPQHSAIAGSPGNQTSSHVMTASGSTIDTTTAYYDTGVPVSTKTPNGTTQYSYDSTQTFATTTTLPTPSSGVSLATSASYDQPSGAIISATGMNAGQTTQVTQYDRLLRPTSLTLPNGSVVTNSYTLNDTEINQTRGSGANADNHTLVDAYGRKSRIAVFNGQTSGSQWYYQVDYCYDATGLLHFQSTAYQGSGFAGANATKQCSGSGTTYSYDALGRMTSSTNADGTTTKQYNGRAVKTTDVNGVQRIVKYDYLGRISAVCEISSNSSMPGSGSPVNCGMEISGTGFLTYYSYDLANHKTTITQAAQTRVFQTDAAGRTIYTKEPERGETNYSYVYDASNSCSGIGLCVTRTRPQANQTNPSMLTTTRMQYDSLGRVASVTYSDGTPTKNFAYDQSTAFGGGSVSLGASKGMLTETWVSFGSSNSEAAYMYDVMGNVMWSDQCLPSSCGIPNTDKILQYTYDLLGNTASVSDGYSETASYTYSPASEVTNVQSSMSGPTYPSSLISNMQNGPFGPVSYQFGNGLSQANSYDSLGRANGGWICYGTPTPACSSQAYGTAEIFRGSRVTASADNVMGQGNNYGYDEFNRLTSTSLSNGAQTFSYTYDRYGNRLSQSAPQGGYTFSASFDTTTNRLNSGGYAYDAAGNLTNDGFHRYAYDAEGNITQVDSGSTATYYYNAMNQRVRADQGSTSREYVYNTSGQRTSIWDGNTRAQIQGQYYWGSRPVAFYTGGSLHFQHQDLLGTERVQTSYNGSMESSYVSYPWGEGYSASGADSDPYHFAMLDHDSESFTEHAQFRQYSSTQGRWMSPDPYDGSYDATDPQSLNRYGYVLNNPLGFVDPIGLSDCTAWELAHGFCVVQTVVNVSTPPPPNVPTITGPGENGPGSNSSSGGSAPSKVGCSTVLPNGNTLGQYINQGRAQMQASVNAGGSFNGGGLANFASIARDYGQIDFKNGAAGSSVLANRAVLGQAGNFAYYAIGSGYLSPGLLDTGAGAYAVTSALLGKKSFSTLTGPMFSDASAASVRNAGLATPGCPQ
jgi:RHS repeat-associated protein